MAEVVLRRPQDKFPLHNIKPNTVSVIHQADKTMVIRCQLGLSIHGQDIISLVSFFDQFSAYGCLIGNLIPRCLVVL